MELTKEKERELFQKAASYVERLPALFIGRRPAITTMDKAIEGAYYDGAEFMCQMINRALVAFSGGDASVVEKISGLDISKMDEMIQKWHEGKVPRVKNGTSWV